MCLIVLKILGIILIGIQSPSPLHPKPINDPRRLQAVGVERGGQLPSVLAPAKRLLSRPLFWSQRVLNDLPLTVKNRIHHLEEIHIVHPKNVSQLQPTPQSLSLSKNQPYSIYSRNANQVTHWGHGS